MDSFSSILSVRLERKGINAAHSELIDFWLRNMYTRKIFTTHNLIANYDWLIFSLTFLNPTYKSWFNVINDCITLINEGSAKNIFN